MQLQSFFFVLTLAVGAIGQTDFPTSDCVDPLQTSSGIQQASIDFATCVQNCGGPKADGTCLTGCACIEYKEYFNCILSGCWNKVYSCEYQTLFVTAGTVCPYLNVATIPFFATQTLTNPGACSCVIATLYAAFVLAPSYELKCQDSDFAQLDACMCCSQSLIVSAYYDICNTTSPSQIAALGGTIPFPAFDTCLPTLDSVDCSSLGSLSVPAADWVKSALPAGTGTYYNQPGSLTSPPYGSETIWLYSIGASAFTNTATAAPYNGNAVAVGSGSASSSVVGNSGTPTANPITVGSPSATESTEGGTETAVGTTTAIATGTATESVANGKPASTSGAISLTARTGVTTNYLWYTCLFAHALLAFQLHI